MVHFVRTFISNFDNKTAVSVSLLEKQFSFKVHGSYEGTQDITLESDLVFGSPHAAKFHYARYKQPVLDLMLPGKKPPPSYVCYYWTS